MNDKIETQDIKIKTLENENKERVKENNTTKEQVDDQVNRSLRNTLVFRGIKGKANESWKTTRDNLHNIIGKLIPDARGHKLIERAHHAKPKNQNGDDEITTPIFAKFFDWNDAQQILDDFKDLNLKKGEKIHVEQMYSPQVTTRRNEALLKRKELKEAGEIVSGYITYPAILMIKKQGERNYVKHSTF